MVVTKTSTKKSQVLQLNGAGHFNSRRRLLEKGWITVCLFFDMGSPVKTQTENWMIKLCDLWGQTIDVSDQYFLS